MSRRISDVEHTTAFFEMADEVATVVMLDVIRGIMRRRFPAKVKKRAKPKLVEVLKEGVA